MSPEIARPSESPRARVLVVDDNHDAARSVAIMLRMLGYETQLAFNGQQAVRLVPEFNPHAVVLDLSMPVMDGYEAARQVRAMNDGHRILLIALTAFSHDESRQKAYDAGFNVYLTKPAESAQLALLLSQLEPH